MKKANYIDIRKKAGFAYRLSTLEMKSADPSSNLWRGCLRFFFFSALKDKGDHTFFKNIIPKINEIAWPELELANYIVTEQHIGNNATGDFHSLISINQCRNLTFYN